MRLLPTDIKSVYTLARGAIFSITMAVAVNDDVSRVVSWERPREHLWRATAASIVSCSRLADVCERRRRLRVLNIQHEVKNKS